MDYFTEMCFITLTYDDEHLPEDYGLHKKHLQDFFKRLRKNTKKKIKYYACGEYGEDYSRPHYHAIILGIDMRDEVFSFAENTEQLRKCKSWTNGFAHVGTVSQDSVRYVTDYVKKKLTGQQGTEAYGLRESPFQIVSQGLGKRYCEQNAETLKTRRYFTARGVPHSLPRYYRDILNIKNLAYTTALKERTFMVELAQLATRMERTGSMDTNTLNHLKDLQRYQQNKNIEARTNLVRKKL